MSTCWNYGLQYFLPTELTGKHWRELPHLDAAVARKLPYAELQVVQRLADQKEDD